jgi:hypothetical protein
MKLDCPRCKRKTYVTAAEFVRNPQCWAWKDHTPHVHCTVCHTILYLPMGERHESC